MWVEQTTVWTRVLVLAIGGLLPMRAATFGHVIATGGETADIALDEPRGALYIANFTAGRIDVLSLSDQTIRNSMHVAAAPSALALAPDGRFLVVTHFGNVQPPGSPANAISIIDLSGGGRQTIALSDPPLGVAFGFNGLALVATTTHFLLLDPASGRTDFVDSLANVTANSLPAAPGKPPVEIVAATMTASSDGRYIFGLTDSIFFCYDVTYGAVKVTGYTASPDLGPRVVSVSRDGSYYAAGWGVFSRKGTLLAQFRNASGLLGVGSHAIDSNTNTLYAQLPETDAPAGAPAMLTVRDADNLTVRDQWQLPENLSGRAVLNSTGDTLYAVSESGVTVLPVGSIRQYHRIAADQEDLVFRGNFCQHGVITRSLRIVDPGGGNTAFSVSTDMTGVHISPATGRTPQTVQVSVDTTLYQDQRGSVIGALTVNSGEAVNPAVPVRLLVSNQRPDERGSPVNVPGTLVDLVADPIRDRFYILRQDRNQVLVFDGSGLSLVNTLRTGNTPTGMALTFDRKYLLVGNDDSQLVNVFDLDSLAAVDPVLFPIGHYPRAVAASGKSILAASRRVGGASTIDRIDFTARQGVSLPSLGVYQNAIAGDTVLQATPNGASILGVSADGNVLLYDANTDLVTVFRKLDTALAGAFAASDEGQFMAGNRLLNASLVPTSRWNPSEFSAGFAFSNGQGLRVTGPTGTIVADSVVERVDRSSGAPLRPMRLVEQPLTGSTISVFTRTLAPLANRNLMIVLTASGFTALAWNFDAAVAPPSISHIVNAASLDKAVAPGSLITIFGTNLSPTNITESQIPLPTAIGESCLTANGAAIPMLFASPSQMNAQLPLQLNGAVTMTLYTPGGVSDDYFLSVQPVAPAIFQSGTAGPLTGIPAVIKASNQQLVTPSNPIHPRDVLTIYATGLGPTVPEVAAGFPGPSTPPAVAATSPDVLLGGVPLTINYAGLAPGEVGVYQINAQAPGWLPEGSAVPLTITQSGISTSVNVRVVN